MPGLFEPRLILETSMAAALAGAGGVALNFAWPVFRGRVAMLAVQAIACVFFATHYTLIGAATGALMTVLAGLQALAAIPLGERPGFRLVYLATLPLIAGGLAASWHGSASVFAALGLVLVSLGRYQLGTVPFRILILCSIPCWTGHNLLTGSVPGLISDAGVLSVGLWSLRREWSEIRAGAASEAYRDLQAAAPLETEAALAPDAAIEPGL
jgi:hypothetical protein